MLATDPGPSCWHLRVILTPERLSYYSCIVHLLHPAHQIQAHTKLISLNSYSESLGPPAAAGSRFDSAI